MATPDKILIDAEVLADVLNFLGNQADYSDEGMNPAGALYSSLEIERHEGLRNGRYTISDGGRLAYQVWAESAVAAACERVVRASAVTVAPEAVEFERRAWGQM